MSVLLDRAGLTQVGHHRTLVAALLGGRPRRHPIEPAFGLGGVPWRAGASSQEHRLTPDIVIHLRLQAVVVDQVDLASEDLLYGCGAGRAGCADPSRSNSSGRSRRPVADRGQRLDAVGHGPVAVACHRPLSYRASPDGGSRIFMLRSLLNRELGSTPAWSELGAPRQCEVYRRRRLAIWSPLRVTSSVTAARCSSGTRSSARASMWGSAWWAVEKRV